MKKYLKKEIIAIIIASIIGMISGKIIFNIYKDSIDIETLGKKIYMISCEKYQNVESLKANIKYNNYIYYEDNGEYNLILGFTEDVNNLEKIKSLYPEGSKIIKMYSNNDEINKEISDYDKLLTEETDTLKIKEIVNKMLTIFKNDNKTLTDITY